MKRWPPWPFVLISFDIPLSLDTLVIPCGIFISPFLCIEIGSNVLRVFGPSKSKRMSHSFWIFVTKQRIELHPSHVRFGDISLVTTGTFTCRGLFSGLRIGQRVMSESKEAPSIRLSKALTIFYGDVNSVVLTLKYPRPDGSFREPSGNAGSRTRVSSFTMIVPSGNSPVCRYASMFFAS